MSDIRWQAVHGMITDIRDFEGGQNDQGCYKFITVQSPLGPVNFVITPSTYFVDQFRAAVGDTVTGYYDANMPVVLIFPPQYRTLVMIKDSPYHHVKVDYFNDQLVSSDGQLKLTIAPFTQIMLTNGQDFTHSPANRNLIVIYGPATRSIPAQTAPYRIIVWCTASEY
jgi:hypothetical protein